MSSEAKKIFPARVVEVVDEYRIVINRGGDFVKKGQRFLIYKIGKELFDPETNESLGSLEILRGTGVVTHVQEKLCTLSSDKRSGATRRTIKHKDPYWVLNTSSEEVIDDLGDILPFENATIGDYVKPI